MKKTLSNLIDKAGLRNVLGFRSNKNDKTRQLKKLSDAIMRRDFKLIKKLMSKGLSLDHLVSPFGTAIHAIYRLSDGDKKILRYFLDHGVDDRARDGTNHTLLDTLVIEGRLDLVKMMIQRNKDFHVHDDSGFTTPAQKAIRYQQDAIIECILEHSSNHNNHAEIVTDMLFEAVLIDDQELAALTFKYKLDKQRIWQNGASLLHFVKSPEMLDLLYDQGFDINQQDDNGVSIISKWVVENQEALVLALLKLGPDLSDNVAGIYDLVITAAKNNNRVLLEGLLEYEQKQADDNINSDKKSGFCSWVLCQAVEDRCSLNVIKYLVNYGADLNGRNYYNQTPLMVAAIKNNPYYVKYLLAHKVEIDVQDDFGRSALMHAVINRSDKCLKVLLSNNVDVSLTDKKGFDVAMHCLVSGNQYIADLLAQHKVALNQKYYDNKTSMIFAAMAGNVEMVEYLINAKVDLNVADIKKRTALMYASANNHIGCVRALIESGANTLLRDKNNHTAANLAKSDAVVEIFERSLANSAAAVQQQDVELRP